MEQSTVQSYIIDKSIVDWKPYYTLDKASLGQIMKTFEKINIIPKNNYEIVLSDELNILIQQLINNFDKLLVFNNLIEYTVYYYNLLGPLPNGTSIDENNHKYIKLKTANIGNLVKALYQRVNYILQRDIPLMYKYREEYLTVFNNMKSNLSKFLDSVKEFEVGFVDAIDNAHKSKFTIKDD